ncbi:MAG: sigma D regulator [Pseudomonadota bacterium]
MPMLTQAEAAHRRFGGRFEAVDRWLDSRKQLLVQYLRLTGGRSALPSRSAISEFCTTLVDYVSAGHFEIYQELLQEAERNGPETEAQVQQLYPRIAASTDIALAFNDRYADPEDELLIERLDADLAALGVAMAERFEHEDALLALLFGDRDLAA